MDDDLDTSWIEESTRITDMDQNYEPEPMEQIAAHFIYINVNNYIEKTKTEYIELGISDDKTRVITKDMLLKIIQQNQTKTHKSKYYLQDILWYNVELKPDNIQKSIYNENSVDLFKQFFKIAQLIQIDDIILQPSIFIFHSLQCLYFVFKEKEMEISTHSIKSILKPTQTKPPIQIMDDDVPRPIAHNTKKVRLDIKQLRKSRKKLNPISLE
jgi:hypothetical protein